MAKAEETLAAAQAQLPGKTIGEALREVLGWLQTTQELPPNSMAREIAREIIAQLSSAVAIKGFKGSPDSYIA